MGLVWAWSSEKSICFKIIPFMLSAVKIVCLLVAQLCINSKWSESAVGLNQQIL